MAYDVNTHQLNWGPLDNVINTAGKHKIKLILTLGDQSGTCDDGYFKGPSWYNGGYNTTIPSSTVSDVDIEPYSAYVKQIVERYATNPTIAFWEPMNEPEASVCTNPNEGSSCFGQTTCNEAAAEQALASFYKNIDTTIRSIDPNHLISAGTEGSGQCGLSGTDYTSVIQAGQINVASYHDYSAPNVTLWGDQWNGMAVREQQMAAIGVPIIVEETGIYAYDPNPSSCETTAQRASDFQAKLTAEYKAGYQGFMPWNWVPPGNTTSCSYDITTGDALFTMLHKNAFGQ